jgi:hypothetical protein
MNKNIILWLGIGLVLYLFIDWLNKRLNTSDKRISIVENNQLKLENGIRQLHDAGVKLEKQVNHLISLSGQQINAIADTVYNPKPMIGFNPDC